MLGLVLTTLVNRYGGGNYGNSNNEKLYKEKALECFVMETGKAYSRIIIDSKADLRVGI